MREKEGNVNSFIHSTSDDMKSMEKSMYLSVCKRFVLDYMGKWLCLLCIERT